MKTHVLSKHARIMIFFKYQCHSSTSTKLSDLNFKFWTQTSNYPGRIEKFCIYRLTHAIEIYFFCSKYISFAQFLCTASFLVSEWVTTNQSPQERSGHSSRRLVVFSLTIHTFGRWGAQLVQTGLLINGACPFWFVLSKLPCYYNSCVYYC